MSEVTFLHDVTVRESRRTGQKDAAARGLCYVFVLLYFLLQYIYFTAMIISYLARSFKERSGRKYQLYAIYSN